MFDLRPRTAAVVLLAASAAFTTAPAAASRTPRAAQHSPQQVLCGVPTTGMTAARMLATITEETGAKLVILGARSSLRYPVGSLAEIVACSK